MKKSSLAFFIIASAILWGLVIIGCALILADTDCYQRIQFTLAGGATAHILFIWGPLVVSQRKKNTRE